MAGRTPPEAFREFRELIQEAISCFARDKPLCKPQQKRRRVWLFWTWTNRGPCANWRLVSGSSGVFGGG